MDYFDFINGKELYHYGVPGMKWGHHKVIDPYESRRLPKINKDGVPERSKHMPNVIYANESKPGLVRRLAISTDKRVESMVRHTPIIGKKIVTNKEVDDSTRAKRGYAILGTTMVLVGGAVVKKIADDKKTKIGQDIIERYTAPQKKPVNPELLKKFEEIQKPKN